MKRYCYLYVEEVANVFAEVCSWIHHQHSMLEVYQQQLQQQAYNEGSFFSRLFSGLYFAGVPLLSIGVSSAIDLTPGTPTRPGGFGHGRSTPLRRRYSPPTEQGH